MKKCPMCAEQIQDEAVKCRFCGERFDQPKTAPKPPAAAGAGPAGVFGTKTIVCPNPNCGYTGPASRKARGSVLVGLFLCLFFLLPGILYFMFKSGYRYYCPTCRLQVSSDS